MKLLLISACGLALAGASAIAQDEEMDFQASCEAYQAEHGGTSDCACLADKVAEDAELADAMSMIQGPADVESAPENVQMALKACPAHDMDGEHDMDSTM
jgi:hypothetical protein